MTSEYRIEFNGDQDRWAKLLTDIHRVANFTVGGFNVNASDLLTELQGMKKALIEVRTRVSGLALTPNDEAYKRYSKLFNPNEINQADFNTIRDHINDWFIEPWVGHTFSKTYTFKEMFALLLKVGETMDNFYMLPVPYKGVFHVCGTHSRVMSNNDLWYKHVTIGLNGCNNSSRSIAFDIDDGFTDRHLANVNNIWKTIPQSKRCLEVAQNIYHEQLDLFLKE